MKKFSGFVLTLIVIASSSCSTLTLESAPTQEISWGNLSMHVPAIWTVEPKGDHLSAEGKDYGENLIITAYTFPPARKLTPIQIIQHYIEVSSNDTSNEFRTTVPYRVFYLKCGEPAAVIVEDLGDNYFIVSYAIASTNSMFTVNFYRTGSPAQLLGIYQKMIESASIKEFSESTCN